VTVEYVFRCLPACGHETRLVLQPTEPQPTNTMVPGCTRFPNPLVSLIIATGRGSLTCSNCARDLNPSNPTYIEVDRLA
jgi:hypothetical protein